MEWSWQGALAGLADPSYGGRALLQQQEIEAKQQEAQAKQQMMQNIMASAGGGGASGGTNQALAMLAMQTGDPRIMQAYIERNSPQALLDEQLKSIQLQNAQADADVKQRMRSTLFGGAMPQQTPNFNPALGTTTQGGTGVLPSGQIDIQALSSLIPQSQGQITGGMTTPAQAPAPARSCAHVLQEEQALCSG